MYVVAAAPAAMWESSLACVELFTGTGSLEWDLRGPAGVARESVEEAAGRRDRGPTRVPRILSVTPLLRLPVVNFPPYELRLARIGKSGDWLRLSHGWPTKPGLGEIPDEELTLADLPVGDSGEHATHKSALTTSARPAGPSRESRRDSRIVNSPTDAFCVKDGAHDRWLSSVAGYAGFDVSDGLERSGFVPTLRNILKPSSGGYEQSTSHPRDMATQVAWVSYLFTVQADGLERPRDFGPKSIIVEAVDGPYMYDAVRVSLWATGAPFMVASSDPIGIDRFKHPEGVPASYRPARWVLDNLFRIVVEEANTLIPFARAVAAEARDDSA